MTVWSIYLEASLTDMGTDIETAIEDVLESLAASPGVMGPVASANLKERWLGARFDIEARDLTSAATHAVEIFRGALTAGGVHEFKLSKGEIEEDYSPIEAPHEREFVTAD